MQPQRNHGHRSDRHDSSLDRATCPPHMPLGTREVPLLAQEHPPLNFARQHNTEVPHHGDPGYSRYRGMRDVVLRNGVKAFENALSSSSPVEYIILQNEKLIVQYHSQSKLSQQELADLQKATHFDKKELQQWYKGTEPWSLHTFEWS